MKCRDSPDLSVLCGIESESICRGDAARCPFRGQRGTSNCRLHPAGVEPATFGYVGGCYQSQKASQTPDIPAICNLSAAPRQSKNSAFRNNGPYRFVGESWKGGPWHGVFEITLTYNKGIAFGMLQGGGLIMTPIAIVIAGFAIWTIYKNANETRWGTVALGLLASGALGNLIDRLFNSKSGVTDMFLLRLANITHGRFSDFPVFNVADSALTVGVVLMAINVFRQSRVAAPAVHP